MNETNPFSAAIGEAARHTDMGTPRPGDPADRERPAKAEPDLSQMSRPQRMQHHATKYAAAYHAGGKPAADAYKQQHPEAAQLWLKPDLKIGTTKPPGYCAAVGSLAGLWLTEPGAADMTNREAVTYLDKQLGAHKRPANDLSRPMNKATRGRCEGVFADRGFTLPAHVKTLSGVKAAAKAALAGALPRGRAFGGIGSIADNLLTIGGKSFKIVPRHGRDYVRLYSQGTETLFRLDRLTDFLEQAGLLGDKPGGLPVIYTEGIGTSRNGLPDEGNVPGFPGTARSPPADCPELPGHPGTEHRTLSERIASLAAHSAAKAALHSNTPTYDGTGPDPLALLPA